MLSGLCAAIGIAEYLYPGLYDLFALHRTGARAWQYLTCLLTHGVEPRAFLWVHLGMNLFGLIPMGMLCEKLLGSKRTLFIALTAGIVTICLFFLAEKESTATVVGISTIVFAFAPISFLCLCKSFPKEGKPAFRYFLTYYFLIELLGIHSTMNPIGMRPAALLMHLSGLLVGAAAAFVYRKLIGRTVS